MLRELFEFLASFNLKYCCNACVCQVSAIIFLGIIYLGHFFFLVSFQITTKDEKNNNNNNNDNNNNNNNDNNNRRNEKTKTKANRKIKNMKITKIKFKEETKKIEYLKK